MDVWVCIFLAGAFFAGAFFAGAFLVGVVFVETSVVREFCCTTCFVVVALVVAVAPACFNARTSLFSSQISTPRDSAFVTLLPGLSPTTSTFVFLLTSPVTRPPAAVIAASASLRDNPDRVPVTTNTRPANRDVAMTPHLSHHQRNGDHKTQVTITRTCTMVPDANSPDKIRVCPRFG